VDSYTTISLLPAASSVRDARREARTWLDTQGVEDFADTELIVAELVTNAIEHGTPPIVVHLWREGDGIRLGVSDGNPVPGVLRPSAPIRSSGLGLRIVDRLVDRWGASTHGSGKVVWAELPMPATSVDLRPAPDDPRNDAREDFDALTERADTTMVVVTASYRGERGGCLVGFHCQCSISPARYAVWISKANHTCRVALQATHLGIHFLGAGDRDLARLFGERSGDEIDKFARCDTTEGRFGVPLLSSCPDRVVARRTTALDDGSDHICFVVEPVDAHRGADRSPMRLGDVSDLVPGHAAEERAPVT